MAPGPKKIVSVASWQHLAIAHALGDVLGHLVMQSIYLQLFHVGARGQTSFMDVTSKSQWWYTHDLSECWTLTLQASFHFFFPWFQSLPCNFFWGERESQASRVWQIWGSTGSPGRWEVHRVHFVQRIWRSVIARESSWKQLTFRHQLKRREKKVVETPYCPYIVVIKFAALFLEDIQFLGVFAWQWICRSTSQVTCYPSMKPAPTRWRPLKQSENTFDDMLHLECVMTTMVNLVWGEVYEIIASHHVYKCT